MAAVTTLPWSRSLGADEFCELEMPDDGRRYELIDGVLLVTPSPFVQHQWLVGEVFAALHAACPADLRTFGAPLDVRLSERTVVQPDVLVVRADDARGTRVTGIPLLCVEVLSDSTRGHDLLLKRERYESAGVTSYWVVDPVTLEIVAWRLDPSGRYREVASTDLGTHALPLTHPFPVTLDLRRPPG